MGGPVMSDTGAAVTGAGTSGQAAGGWPGAAGEPDPRRWLILAVIASAQLMVVLDATVMNIALPSAQRDLHFSNIDRQWVVTAYALSFGSLLLLGGRLADMACRRAMFITGLAGFAVASAVGGAAVSFPMLVTARACQGAFGALLAPAALSLLATTFTDPEERGKAFGVYGAVAAGGGAVGLLLGGALTSYLSWRWCLYINLIFAGAAVAGAILFLTARGGPRSTGLDIPGVVLVSGAMFCLVYGFSNAAAHSWAAPPVYGFLAAGTVLAAAFASRMSRARSPLLPPRIILDRNRGAAYLGILFAGAGMFGIFLFVTYYMQDTLNYSPVITGAAFLPMAACIGVASNVSNIALMPRTGPRPVIAAGFGLAAAGTAWLTGIGVHSGYAGAILGPTMVTGAGLGLIFSIAFNTGTHGVPPRDAGVASATVNTGQQLGGSIGAALLNTIAASATTSYLAAHLRGKPAPQVAQASLVHGYTTAFWVTAGIFAGAAVLCGLLMSRAHSSQPPPPGAVTQVRDTG